MNTYDSYENTKAWEPNAIDKNPYYQRELEIVARRVERQNWQKALDLGCGYGRAQIHLKRFAKTWIGMDASYPMLKRSEIKPVWQINGEINTFWPFRDQSFDLIVGLQIINHAQSLLFFFQELKRILSKQGKAYLSMGNSASYISLRQGKKSLDRDGYQRHSISKLMEATHQTKINAKMIGGSGLFSPHSKLFFFESLNSFHFTSLWSHLVIFELTSLNHL